MEYYLETNSLRQLIPRVDHYKIRNLSYTSILALMEIASGINDESSFQRRQPILRKFLNSNFTIILALPETLYFNAFGFNVDDTEIINGISRVLFKLIAMESYESFISEMANSKNHEHYKFLQKFDTDPSKIFRNSFSSHIDEARNGPGFKALINEYLMRWNSKNPEFAEEFYDTLLDHFVTGLYNNQSEITPTLNRTYSEIKESYDHSIDIFLIISSFYADQKISYGSLPGKNDYFDLAHLTYLNDLKTKIVTDDKLLHKLLINSFSQNVISTTDFINQNSI